MSGFALSLVSLQLQHIGTCSRSLGGTYSWRSVYRWYSSFKNGRNKLGDLYRGERTTVRIQPTVSACQQLVNQDKTIGIHKLSRTLGVSYGTAHTMLHHDLELKKKAPKLIPHDLTAFDHWRRLAFAFNMLDQFAADPRCLQWICTTDESWFHVYDPRPKQLNMAWLAHGGNRPQIVRRQQFCRKVMLIPFFDHQGLVHWEFFQGVTINKEHFHAVLERAHKSLLLRRAKVRRNKSEYLLHMDNAPAHTSRLAQDFLKDSGWQTLAHPPYSPDLSPADFLFPKLKRLLHGHNFQNIQNLTVSGPRPPEYHSTAVGRLLPGLDLQMPSVHPI